ncbi:uncharacterized protein [Diadema setosum]|uniref:uncharacterized protein n=1 Tax=Diadema setosum TaxID=31175 RepID=UPI003B3AE665
MSSSPTMVQLVQQCTKDLKDYYRVERRHVAVDAPNFSDHVDLDEIYTDLALIDQYGETITYEDLLSNSRRLSNRILIHGEGGVGKTTLCSKIAWDWCQGRILQDLDMVIIIPLRDVTDGMSLGGIVKRYLSDSNAATEIQIDNYIAKNPSKILLVFDGFDEFKGEMEQKSSSEIIRILNIEQYKTCKVIATSRPWRRDELEMPNCLLQPYTFISVHGFNEENLTTYIKKYFRIKRKDTLTENFISFMKENDIVWSNMAPFPIYCSMLCLLWSDSSEEKRKEIREMQTVSELLGEMISFLKGHYTSKETYKADEHFRKAGRAIQDIGEIALNGLLHRDLSFPEEQFKECQDAMETCCRVGVLTTEKKAIKGPRRSDVDTPSLIASRVSFPRQLFQEYVAGIYVEHVYADDPVKYNQLKQTLLNRHKEFRYLLYFASAFRKEVGLDIINGLTKCAAQDFCVDVAFECHTGEAAKALGERWEEFSVKKKFYISEHTNTGVVFIVHNNQVRSLSIDHPNFGRIMSRDLAEGMCSSRVLRKVNISYSRFHADFYKILADSASTCQIQDLSLFIYTWNDGRQDQSPIGGDMAQWVCKMPSLSTFRLTCNNVDLNFFKTVAAEASFCQIQDLNLVLVGSWDDSSQHQSSVGGYFAKWVSNMSSLLRFSLTCCNLDCDFLSEAIASASSCQIQDLELAFDSWDGGSEHQSSMGAELAQWVSTMPSLQSFNLNCLYLDGGQQFLAAAVASASSCQIQNLTLTFQVWCTNAGHASSASKDLARWVCTLPRLSTFSVQYLLHEDFFITAMAFAESCQIREFSIELTEGWSGATIAAGGFAKFLCCMPHLQRARIKCKNLPRTFFTIFVLETSSCKIEDIIVNDKPLTTFLRGK